jgi:hypothetical protein
VCRRQRDILHFATPVPPRTSNRNPQGRSRLASSRAHRHEYELDGANQASLAQEGMNYGEQRFESFGSEEGRESD